MLTDSFDDAQVLTSLVELAFASPSRAPGKAAAEMNDMALQLLAFACTAIDNRCVALLLTVVP